MLQFVTRKDCAFQFTLQASDDLVACDDDKVELNKAGGSHGDRLREKDSTISDLIDTASTYLDQKINYLCIPQEKY